MYSTALPIGEHENHTGAPFEIKIENYSSLTKLIRVTAWCCRFANKMKGISDEQGALTSAELRNSTRHWERFIQRKEYGECLKSIRSNGQNQLKLQLGLNFDENGILRCSSRLQEPMYQRDRLYPVLLPKKNYFTTLVIQQIHQRLFHAGVSHTLAQMRGQYWIPQGRREVQRVLNKCSKCRKAIGGPFRLPTMPPWPAKKVIASPPFSYTGLDYFGPLYARDERVISKRWVCLYTCLVTRAIHLEIVNDLSASEFLEAFRRFISRRGKPIEIISDNASQFKMAKTIIERAWVNITIDDTVQSYIADRGIKWNFILQFAPWMGGFYERLVGLVKVALRKSLAKECLTTFQLQTIITEIEGVLNCRPLVYVGADIESGFALTPADFLLINSKSGIPILEEESDPEYLPAASSKQCILDKWKHRQLSLNKFWDIWNKEYLLSLRERSQTVIKQKKGTSRAEPRVGTIVIISERLPRGSWKMGKILECIAGNDGQSRSAKVLLASGKTIVRSIGHLIPIECSSLLENNDEAKPIEKTQNETNANVKESETNENEDLQSGQEAEANPFNDRPKRAAAMKATKRISEMISEGII